MTTDLDTLTLETEAEVASFEDRLLEAVSMALAAYYTYMTPMEQVRIETELRAELSAIPEGIIGGVERDLSRAFTENVQQTAQRYLELAMAEARVSIPAIVSGAVADANAIFAQEAARAVAQSMTDGFAPSLADALDRIGMRGVSCYTTANGSRVPVDVGIRRWVHDALREHELSQTLDWAQETGVHLVEVSITGNARPSHREWQGSICSLDPSDTRYPYFNTHCRVGDMVDGFGGYNCQHRIALYYEGEERVFEDPLEGSGVTPEEYTALVNRQRSLERGIRRNRRAAELLERMGMDSRRNRAAMSEGYKRLNALLRENKVLERQRWREDPYYIREVQRRERG